jgi:choline-sulfatase
VSFTHPHAPFTASLEHWNRYRDDEIDLPEVPALPVEQQDMQSIWLAKAREAERYPIDSSLVLNARHAYYGMISYIDDKVGRILDTLRSTSLAEETVVIFLSDHGEMMGERGMWFKSTFFEWSARVPLIVRWPGVFPSGRVDSVVSLVDLMPTLIELAGGDPQSTPVEPFDGKSLVGLLKNREQPAWPNAAISEYTADGVCAPCRMIRKGPFKYIYVHGHPAQLYDLRNDPRELENLAGSNRMAGIESELRQMLLRDWDPEEITRQILKSQQRRLRIQNITAGNNRPLQWSFNARYDDGTRYVRGAKASEVKARKRFPYVAPPKR